MTGLSCCLAEPASHHYEDFWGCYAGISSSHSRHLHLSSLSSLPLHSERNKPAESAIHLLLTDVCSSWIVLFFASVSLLVITGVGVMGLGGEGRESPGCVLNQAGWWYLTNFQLSVVVTAGIQTSAPHANIRMLRLKCFTSAKDSPMSLSE